MTGSRRRVVVTGAAGRIGKAIAAPLADRWDLQLTDAEADGPVTALDVTDVAACRATFSGADAVVHLAADPNPAAVWDELWPVNVLGAHNVAAAAGEAGVRRLVLASSLHAVSARPEHTQARATDQARPANLYGATKVWAEALGSWVAATTTTSVVALRIGYFGATPPPADGPAWERGAWLSPRDAAELVRAAVEAEGVRYLVANGISANRHRTADLHDTMRLLDYRPADDAWQHD